MYIYFFHTCLAGLLEYSSKVSWHARLETRDSILASQSSNALSFEMRGSSLEFRWSRIEDPRSWVFRKNDVVESRSRSDIRTVDQCLQIVRCSVTVWIVGVRQAFNKCKSIFSFPKIYPVCTVYVAFARRVPRFSQMNGAAWRFILMQILMKITTFESLNLLVCQASTSFV